MASVDERVRAAIPWGPDARCCRCGRPINEEDFEVEEVVLRGLLIYLHLHAKCRGKNGIRAIG